MTPDFPVQTKIYRLRNIKKKLLEFFFTNSEILLIQYFGHTI